MTTDALKKLHTAMLDTREGYEVAEREAETPELKSLFHEMIGLRTKDHEAIHSALVADGQTPDDSGSFMATVHKAVTRARSAVTRARSAVTGLDADALSPLISGEQAILGEYDAAIEEAATDGATRSMLLGQKAALSTKISEMKAMAAA